MKLDSEGRAFFVQQTNQKITDKELISSPIPSDDGNDLTTPSPKGITDKSANSNKADEGEDKKESTNRKFWLFGAAKDKDQGFVENLKSNLKDDQDDPNDFNNKRHRSKSQKFDNLE